MPTATISKESLVGERAEEASTTTAAGTAATAAADVAALGADEEGAGGTVVGDSVPTAGESGEAAAPMSGTGLAEGATPQRQVGG